MKYFLASLLFIASLTAQGSGLQVIQLKHQSAQSMIPIVRQLIGEKAVVTGSGYKLFVRATPDQLADIHKIISEIDVPVKQLLISVRQNSATDLSGSHDGISGDIGDQARVRFGDSRHPGGGASIRYNNGDDALIAYTTRKSTRTTGDISQQVRTLSGKPAYISIGQTRPLPIRQTVVKGTRVIRTDSTYMQESNTGFYVIPRVQGDQVTLDISAQQQQFGNSRYMDRAKVVTSVSGKLNEWIDLGSSQESGLRKNTTLFNAREFNRQDLRNISIKVTIAQ